MTTLSTHVLDIERGAPAAGVPIELYRGDHPLARAETNADGPVMNIVPKEGGNTFRGAVYGNFTGSKVQSNNFDSSLAALGLTSVNTNNKIWDFNPNGGGRIMRARPSRGN